MFLALTFVVCATILLQADSVVSLKARIVNGNLAKPTEFPYQVSIRLNGAHNCGGSILNKNYVLTAAHCVPEKANEQLNEVIAGTINLNRLSGFASLHRVSKFIVHENYNGTDHWNNDIALVKVEPPFQFSKYVRPAKLPAKDQQIEYNSTATISGFGRTATKDPTSPILLKTDVSIVDEATCNNEFERPTNLCTVNLSRATGFCSGDSGGPLTFNGTVVGLVSWSFYYGCASEFHNPQLYTKVSSYLDWISTHLKDN